MGQILIIDDEKMIRDMLSSRLKDLGYEPILAKNGKEGLKQFKKHKPPVTILDLKMPVMDGIEFLHNLKPNDFLTNAIIVFTGHGDNNDIEECYKLGVQSFLRKPVNFFEMMGSIKRAFDLVGNMQKINQLNDKLLESNHRISSILQNIPDLIWEIDTNLEFTYASNNVKEVLGFSGNELIGKQVTEFLSEEDTDQFLFKFKDSKSNLKNRTEGLVVKFKTKDNALIPIQLLGNGIEGAKGKIEKMLITARNMKEFSAITEQLQHVSSEMQIQVDEKLDIVFADESIKQFLEFELSDKQMCGNIESCLVDGNAKDLLEFAFKQKEDLPFPIELKTHDASNKEHVFSVHLKYEESGPYLAGNLVPLAQESKLAFMVKQVDKRLQNSVEITEEMKADIVVDCFNMASETLVCIKKMADFAYEEEQVFNIDEYFEFIKTRQVNAFMEHLKVLANKVHSLKGSTGFILPGAKELCHQIEELLKPLMDSVLVYTSTTHRMLLKFIYKIQEMLEDYQESGNDKFSIEEIRNSIDDTISKGFKYLENNTEAFNNLFIKRSIDTGESRKRKTDEYLSVSQNGYGLLSQQVKNLFYMFSETLSDEHKIQAGNLYNEFLDTHQQIQKVPLDLSRYERLIPSLSEQYGKEAIFTVNDHGVHADREFWNAIHEILNHTLKNAVIHGIETAEQREKLTKEKTGKISVDIREDALSIYVAVSDDGQGIDVDSVRKKAVSNKAVPEEEIENMSEEEIFNLVFAQGISTADAVDDNAGRGVGMNAVQEALHSFQGTCRIQSEKGEGCSWHFTFPKSNVSLSCFIVTVNDFKIAIPEDCVEAFYGYKEENISWINQQPNFRQNSELIPLLESKSVFDEDTSINEESLRRVLILKTEKEKMGMVINDIIHHANLPIMALPEEFRAIPEYLGATLYGSDPVLVINAGQI